MTKTREQLEAEWARLYPMHKKETLETYNDTVRRGNKQTYSEFVEAVRKDWVEEMLKKP